MAKHHKDGASENSKTPGQRITGSALALQCWKAHAKINGKMGNSTPCKIVTPENFMLKLCTRDDVGELTRQANFGLNRFSGGFSPNRRNRPLLTALYCHVLFFYLFTRSYAQVEPLYQFSGLWHKRRFRARLVLLGVRNKYWQCSLCWGIWVQKLDRFAEGLNTAKVRNTAIMASGQNHRQSKRITGSALALQCCKARAKINKKINRKMRNSTPCKIVIGAVGASPQIDETLCLFLTVLFCADLQGKNLFSRSYAQVEPLERFSRFMPQNF